MKTMKAQLCALLIYTTFAMTSVHGAAAADKTKPPKPYPLDTCVVSGEKFGGTMGEPFVFIHGGREVLLCCKGCKKAFDKEPAKYMAEIDEAAKKVKPYTRSTCIVSGKKLGPDAPAAVYRSQEYQFCCKDCVKEFRKDPARFAQQLARSPQ